MPFTKGHPKYPGQGRPLGSKSKKTIQIEQLVASVLTAFDELGGVEWLKKVALNDPKIMAQLMTKLLPSKVESDVTIKNPEEIKVEFVNEEPTPPEELKDEDVGDAQRS
jgi:hypothetical protein